MFDISPEQLATIYNAYVIPSSIKIVIALLIFLIAPIIVKMIAGVIGRVPTDTKLDKILVHFILQKLSLIFFM